MVRLIVHLTRSVRHANFAQQRQLFGVANWLDTLFWAIWLTQYSTHVVIALLGVRHLLWEIWTVLGGNERRVALQGCCAHWRQGKWITCCSRFTFSHASLCLKSVTLKKRFLFKQGTIEQEALFFTWFVARVWQLQLASCLCSSVSCTESFSCLADLPLVVLSRC